MEFEAVGVFVFLLLVLYFSKLKQLSNLSRCCRYSHLQLMTVYEVVYHVWEWGVYVRVTSLRVHVGVLWKR
ncbi:expressed unknown protein [Ectocarpus siliculosus]|uniref:Uncharacterized protein n=1 Tax=Ectocarpus siliculosus TaxID=2880 RepID=D7FIN6_ECTSI|nr:expressed unknown protein [Ectocarpus siliculosus]|eukprot:CBJ28854.1 expressed unknown protein [Ectocarpus siliculosus]